MASTHYLPLLTLFSLLLSLVYSNSNAYVLPNQFFINCGSTSDVVFTGRNFISDVKPTSFSLSGHTSTTAGNTNNPELIYQTARVFNKKSWYKLKADGTNTFVMVRLHFSPMSSSDHKLEVSKFDVSILGFALLSNFTVNSTVIREFIVPIGSEPRFRIEFAPSDGSSSAFVNAIEAFTTPPDLFVHNVTLPHLMSLPGNDGGGFVNLASDHAFDPVHRVNVGGQKIGVEEDTLRRIWVPDDSFLLNGKPAVKNRSFDGGIFYENGGATQFHAPDSVYGTAKELDADSNEISWKFGVNKKATYLVRAHFCNIITSGLPDSIDEFDFVIYSHRKAIKWADKKRLATAFFDDSVVDSDNFGIVNISIGTILDKGQLAFLNGLEIMELLKKSNPDYQGSDGNSKDYKNVFIIVGCVVFVVVLLLGFLIGLKYAKVKQRSQAEISYGGDSDTSITVDQNLKLSLKVPFADISFATNNFDENLMIGSGGFGKVYKGILGNGREVAVKRGEKGHGQGRPEFVTEILVFSRIRHRHLVSLIGYCDENSEMILVYEFMEKGTLQDHLYNANENHPKLSWEKDSRSASSTNILLDKDYVAKVADFGISRSDNVDPTETSFIKGSFGYMDPEYLSYLKLTKKSDVYSFGVVLLEVLCARPAILPGDNLAHWAIKEIENGNVDAIIDPFLAGTINENSLRNFLETVKGSLKVTGDERPSMDEVKWNLKYALNFQQLVAETHEDSTIMESSLHLRMSMIHRLPSYGIDDDSFANGNSASSFASGSKAIDEAR
ncbi:hypothetical protein OSB04_007311 [Centaurea solstitialis]|uniref:Protein kinase domain-containing protein n=1 Tax=Centaurea solstitialis TaxID=347529 RepID=A0AA38TV60_9ASTR|nr:hypothetical protein OSB04_007311 [Centaurea solstitialis]